MKESLPSRSSSVFLTCFSLRKELAVAKLCLHFCQILVLDLPVWEGKYSKPAGRCKVCMHGSVVCGCEHESSKEGKMRNVGTPQCPITSVRVASKFVKSILPENWSRPFKGHPGLMYTIIWIFLFTCVLLLPIPFSSVKWIVSLFEAVSYRFLLISNEFLSTLAIDWLFNPLHGTEWAPEGRQGTCPSYYQMTPAPVGSKAVRQ